MRWDTSTQCFARHLTAEVTVADVVIPAQSRVILFYRWTPAKSAVRDGTVRAGRSPEIKEKLIRELYTMYQRISGIPQWDLVVAIREIPASSVMEAGHILPEPNEEAALLEKHGGSWEAT